MHAPDYLTEGAKQEWRRVSKLLLAARVLTEADRTALAAYCTCYDRWVEAEKKVHASGLVAKTTNGNYIQNPYLAVANRAMGDMCKLMVEFGMTPSSRSRIKASEDEPLSMADILFAQAAEAAKDKNDDPLDEFRQDGGDG